MRTYFIRKGIGEYATLFTRIRQREPNVDILVSTNLEVLRSDWEKHKSKGTLDKFYSTGEGKTIYRKLTMIDEALDNLVKQKRLDRESIKEAVDDVVYQEAREQQRQAEEAERLRKVLEEEERRKNVLRYLDNFIVEISSGVRMFRGSQYGKNTIKVWKTFRKVLGDFYSLNPFTWDDINRQLADNFTYYLQSRGYMVKTINKHITMFRALINYAFVEKYHDNAGAESFFIKKKVTEDDKAKEIYLTAEELQALYEQPLSGEYDIIRDIFLVGCYTCQRFSDYSTLKEGNFTKTSKGTKVVKVIQKKTKNAVVIPILNDNLMRIAKKYNYNMPERSDVELNRTIKSVMKIVAEKVPSLNKLEVTRLTMKEIKKEEDGKVKWRRNKDGNVVKPRYELVTSHTARRSGITNLYLSGKFDTFQMMSISGHKDQRTFMDYIKLSSDELADSIAQKMREEESISNAVLF